MESLKIKAFEKPFSLKREGNFSRLSTETSLDDKWPTKRRTKRLTKNVCLIVQATVWILSVVWKTMMKMLIVKISRETQPWEGWAGWAPTEIMQISRDLLLRWHNRSSWTRTRCFLMLVADPRHFNQKTIIKLKFQLFFRFRWVFVFFKVQNAATRHPHWWDRR